MEADASDFPQDLVSRWDICAVERIADTRTSRIFRVVRRDGSSAIAKLLKPQGLHERSGFDFLQWRRGFGTVRLLDVHQDCGLLEDAGSLTLRAWRSVNSDQAASGIVASVVRRLHSDGPDHTSLPLTPLRQHFRALFAQAAARHSPSLSEPLRWCATIAEDLIGRQTDIRPLHGDLHHENILSGSSRGWLAIDPQGLVGDAAYDVANIFGNPDGAFPEIIHPDRIKALMTLFAALIGCSPDKILRYAIAHAGLSVSWAIEDGLPLGTGSDASERLAFLSVARPLLEQCAVSP